MGLIKEKFKKTLQIDGEWHVGAYRWKAPKGLLDEYIKYFKEKNSWQPLQRMWKSLRSSTRDLC